MTSWGRTSQIRLMIHQVSKVLSNFLMVSSAIFGFLLHQVIKHPHWLGLFEKWNAIQAENNLLNQEMSKIAVATMYLFDNLPINFMKGTSCGSIARMKIYFHVSPVASCQTGKQKIRLIHDLFSWKRDFRVVLTFINLKTYWTTVRFIFLAPTQK